MLIINNAVSFEDEKQILYENVWTTKKYANVAAQMHRQEY